MSNELAIATVTATLSEWVRIPLEDDVDGAGVSMVRPDQIEDLEGSGVNIYLYQVTPNPAYRNADLPTRNSGGHVVQRPQVALDLHYMLTFFGTEASLEPQRAMGSVMRTLHAKPVLSRQVIEDTIASSSFNYLLDSNLAEQIEPIKLTPLSLSLDDFSKLWSVFFQTAYRLSVAYVANLVLIEADEEIPQTRLPVRARNIYAWPFRDLYVEKVVAQEPPQEEITNVSTCIITGRNLRGEITRVRIGEAEFSPLRASLSDTRISIDLETEAPSSGTLRAGVQALRLVHRLLMGTPETEHVGVESNVVAFALRPRIHMMGGSPDIQVSAIQTDADGNDYRQVTVHLLPDVDRRQRVELLINEYGTEVDPQTYHYPAEPRGTDSATVDFIISPEISGEFLFRVQVDGAQSPLQLDEDELSPTYHRYIQPRRSIP
jgi:hypothetical protein